MIGRDADIFTRSEIPIPIPSEVERQQQPAEFDVLQYHVKALDQLLHNMADIDDMADALDDAAKKAGRTDDYHAKAHRQARAYKLTQIVLTAAMQQHQLVEGQMVAFLASAPSSRAILRTGSRRRRRNSVRAFLTCDSAPVKSWGFSLSHGRRS